MRKNISRGKVKKQRNESIVQRSIWRILVCGYSCISALTRTILVLQPLVVLPYSTIKNAQKTVCKKLEKYWMDSGCKDVCSCKD